MHCFTCSIYHELMNGNTKLTQESITTTFRRKLNPGRPVKAGYVRLVTWEIKCARNKENTRIKLHMQT